MNCVWFARRLEESSASVIGNFWPTKSVAGCPSFARSRIPAARSSRPALSVREKSAVMPGSVAKNVELPPPTSSTGGKSAARLVPVARGFCVPKMLWRVCSSVPLFWAFSNWRTWPVLRVKA